MFRAWLVECALWWKIVWWEELKEELKRIKSSYITAFRGQGNPR